MKDNNLKLMDADEACKDLGITPHSLRFTSTVSLNIVGKFLDLQSILLKLIIIIQVRLELVSKELNHFGVIACLFRQIGGHSSIFLLFCFFETVSL